jgi:hypothetical protein
LTYFSNVMVTWIYSLDINLLLISAHNSHQSCICVVSPDDGKVMPKTCRDFEPQ